MNIPYWLLRLLPMWEFICPKCRKEVKQNSHRCPSCGEHFPLALKVPPTILKDPKKLEAYVHQHVFPRVSEFERNYLTKYFTVIFSDGFESGDFSAWTTTYGTPTIVTSPTHHGTKAMEINANSEGVRKILGSSYSDLFMRCYVYFPTISDIWATFLGILNASAAVGVYAGIIVDGANTFWRLQYPSGETYYQVTINPLTWYCVEIERKVGTGNGVAKLWVDGVNVLSKTTETIATNAKVCDVYHYNVITSIFDCVVVADAYIGPEVEGQPYISRVQGVAGMRSW